MREDRLARPNRAGFLGVVTEGDDEIEWHIFELIPRFTVGIRCVDFEILAENFQRERMRRAFRTRSCAVGFEAHGSNFFQQVFGKNTPCGVAGAEEHDCETRFVWIHGVLADAGAFVFEGFINPSAVRSHLLKGLEIGTEPLISRRTVLEAFEIGFELYGGLCRKAVNPPCSVASALDHSPLTEISEMLGHFGLRDAKNFLEVTDTKRTA